MQSRAQSAHCLPESIGRKFVDRTGTDDDLDLRYEFDLESLLASASLADDRATGGASKGWDIFHIPFFGAQFKRHGTVVVTFIVDRDAQPSRTDLKSNFRDRLMWLFEEELVEDCVEHPAQEVIHEALDSDNHSSVLNWLLEFACQQADPNFAASVLRCIGREEGIGYCGWRSQIVASALSSEFLEVRDAGVRAAESWEDPYLLSVLVAHNESVGWLRDYLDSVIHELKP